MKARSGTANAVRRDRVERDALVSGYARRGLQSTFRQGE
jgi:hypothetical protein